MQSIDVAAFTLGVLLTLGALLGGNFKLFDVELPVLSARIRVIWSVFGIVLIFLGMYFSLDNTPATTPNQPSNTSNQTTIEEIMRQVESLRKEVDQLSAKLNTASQPTNQSAVSARLSQIDNELTDVVSKTATLEQVILRDPIEALAIPMLRKDLESTNKDLQSNISALAQDVERLYQLFFAFVIAMAVGILTLALGSVLQERKKST